MKPTVFFVIDTETCRFDGMVFDIGWKAIDRKGREYSQGSYLCADVLETDTPYYRKKIAAYWFKVNKSITPVRFSTVRNIFNQEISRLQNKGHRCVVCAYNAAFDQRVLDKTSKALVGRKSKFVKSQRVDWLDIWLFWAMTCPQSAKEMPKLKSGRIKTTAEAVAQFEIAKDYEHLHEGFADAEGEAEILRTVFLMDAPYQIKKCDRKNTPVDKDIFYILIDTRKNSVIETDESRKYLESIRNRLNTDWFFDKYV